jgi:hypothetical protein
MGHKYAPLLEDDDGLTSVKRDLDAAGPAADMMSVTRTGKRAITFAQERRLSWKLESDTNPRLRVCHDSITKTETLRFHHPLREGDLWQLAGRLWQDGLERY